MKQFLASDIRNFAIVGHGASGKTCLAEAMLKIGGEINRLGTIEDGSTTSDYHPGEKSRQISIHSTPLHMEWMDKKFNMIDTPGFYWRGPWCTERSRYGRHYHSRCKWC